MIFAKKSLFFASAVLFTAFAACGDSLPWFNAGIADLTTWPTDGSTLSIPGAGIWNNTLSASLGGQEGARKLLIESSDSAPLEFQTAVPKSPADANVSITANISFSAGAELPAPDQTMKGAVTVLTNETTGACYYYGLAKDPNGATNVWRQLLGQQPIVGTSSALSMVFRNASATRQVRYVVNGTTLTSSEEGEWQTIVTSTSDETVSVIGCLGSGELHALAGSTTETVIEDTLTIPELEDMTITAVKANGTVLEPQPNGTYLVPRGALVTVEFAPIAGKYLDRSSTTFTMTESTTLSDLPTFITPADFLSITEVMASNGGTLRTENGRDDLDWIEIHNSSATAIDISGWYLHDTLTDKKSKWKTIQGTCIVPANGYAIVWADKDYEDFTANEAYTRVGLASDGEEVFLADTNGVQMAYLDFHKPQIKDVSVGPGRLSHTLLGSDAENQWRIGDGEWNAVTGGIGMGTLETGFKVVTYRMNTSIESQEAAEEALAIPSRWTSVTTNTSATIAFNGNGGETTNLFNYAAFPGGIYDNMVVVITGAIQIPAEGQWTFSLGCEGSSSIRISRGGVNWSWEDDILHGYAPNWGTFSLPEAGTYEVRIVYFKHTGGGTLDFAVAQGEKDWELDPEEFKLIGSQESGIAHGSIYAARAGADVTEAMLGNSTEIAWRGTFERPENAAGAQYRLKVKYSDGFRAYLNNVLVLTVPADANRSAEDAFEEVYFDLPSDQIAAGVNTLDVVGVNNAIDDADFFLAPEVVAVADSDKLVYYRRPTPGAANGDDGGMGPTYAVAFSEPHGWKTESFNLELSCPDDPEADIYYTLDGSSPTIHSTKYTGPIAVAHTTVIRAAVPDADSILQIDNSATYLFLDEVMAQSATPPTGFPANGAVNSQAMRYEMNQTIVNNYRNEIRNGFTNGIATISIVTDRKNLFDKSTGIYVNASGNGSDWERQIMLEQFSPTNSAAEYSVPCGLRIRGAFSRGSSYPKHSFRFFFRNKYGQSKLNFPMFENEGSTGFDKIDLRTAQNYSWANGNDKFTNIEELWSRDSQRDLGHSYHRTRFYHLFINGVYWGVYQTEERTCQKFGEQYFGGKDEDYDVVRTSQPGYVTGIVEGQTTGWHNFWDMSVNQGYSGSYVNNYKKAMGLNPDGSRNPAYPVYLNPENVMAYMLVTHFTGDSDSPAASGSDKANNCANLWNRKAATNDNVTVTENGWIFHKHDAEHSLGTQGHGYNTDYLTRGTEAANSNMRQEKNFNPAELHYKLLQNDEYRMQYADFVHRHMVREDGQMTGAAGTARFRQRMDEFGSAVSCEAARWGGGRTAATWTNACNNLISFINNRGSYLIGRFQARGWYPNTTAPRVKDASGENLPSQAVIDSDTVFLANGNGSGTVYYTTDGSDPRLEGGNVSSTAQTYTGSSSYVQIFGRNSSWRYFDWGRLPDADSESRPWYAEDYVVNSNWGTGNGTLGFKKNDEKAITTTVAKFVNHASSGTQVSAYYFRREFTLTSAQAASRNLRLNILFDDCYALYINGVKVDRQYLADNAGYSTFSDGGSAHLVEENRDISIPAGILKAGVNVIAAEVHQNSGSSTDIYFDLGLSVAIFTGGIQLENGETVVKARVRSAGGEWSPLENVTVISNSEPMEELQQAGLRVLGVNSSTAEGVDDAFGDVGEFVVFTNLLTDAEIDLAGVRFTCQKVGKNPSLDLTLPSIVIPPGGAVTLNQADYWPTAKITNGAVDMFTYDRTGEPLQTLHFESSWWNKDCDGTGAYFVAADVDTNEVVEASQWMPSVSAIQSNLRLFEVYSSTADGSGDGSEYFVLTNLTGDAKLDLGGARITFAKTGNDPSLDITFTNGTLVAKNGTITFTKAVDWPDAALKITNGKVDIVVYDAWGRVAQTGHVEASWWDKACDATGASFLALEFGATVTENTQWCPSFYLPMSTDKNKSGIAKAIGDDATGAIRDWITEMAKTVEGQAAINAFSGNKATVKNCYLVDVPLENDPQIEIEIPALTMDVDGSATISGRLTLKGVEAEKTIRGTIYLYRAAEVDELDTTEYKIPLGNVFPLVTDPITIPGADRQFFQLRVE